MYLQGDNSSELAESTEVTGNTFENQYYMGIRLRYQDAPMVSGNSITTNSTRSNFYGMYLEYCDNEMRIDRNRLNNLPNGYGISQYNCDGSEQNPGGTANNFVHMTGTSNAYGLYESNSSYQAILFNSINVSSSNATNGRAIYLSSGFEYFIVNNIFSNQGGGYSYYVNYPGSVAFSDHNNLYTSGPTLAYWSGDQATLADLQSASTEESNSLSLDPSCLFLKVGTIVR